MPAGFGPNDEQNAVSGDLYDTLGVKKGASADEIRAAYRRLAKENHPDLNPGDTAAEERFKRVAAAFDVLGDEDKRARYDKGEIDAQGQEQAPQGGWRDYADSGAGRTYHNRAGYADFADLGDIFSDLFAEGAFGEAQGRGGFQGSSGFKVPGQDVRYQFTVDFLDAVNGATKRVTMPDGKTLDIAIPAGLRDGQTLRLKGQGQPGASGGKAGDALIEMSVGSHPFFRRDGADIRVELPVTLAEAVLGAKIKVPTPEGSVSMTIPKGSNTGSVLRLKGKGVPLGRAAKRGDQYVELRVVLPDAPDSELQDFVKRWSESHDYSVRDHMET